MGTNRNMGRRPGPGTDPPETTPDGPRTPAVDIDAALRRLAQLDAQRQAARAERLEIIREMREVIGPGRIAELLGISRQQVHKLLRE